MLQLTITPCPAGAVSVTMETHAKLLRLPDAPYQEVLGHVNQLGEASERPQFARIFLQRWFEEEWSREFIGKSVAIGEQQSNVYSKARLLCVLRTCAYRPSTYASVDEQKHGVWIRVANNEEMLTMQEWVSRYWK